MYMLIQSLHTLFLVGYLLWNSEAQFLISSSQGFQNPWPRCFERFDPTTLAQKAVLVKGDEILRHNLNKDKTGPHFINSIFWAYLSF